MQTLSTALHKAENFVEARISKVGCLAKPRIKFLCWLFERWLMLPVRYNFLNLSRYGGYSEKAIRNQMSEPLPFRTVFHQLFAGLRNKECIAVFDPCYLTKSGKHTYGLAKYWSGTAQRAQKGLEAACLAIIDVADATAYSLEVVQTPATATGSSGGGEGLIKHYSSIITQRAADILQYSSVMVADGYFMKESFIGELTKVPLTVITKARHDANMRYLYKGVQSKGRGRKKLYDGKVNWQAIDKRRWKRCYEDDNLTAYQAVVYSVALKRQVKVVYVQSKNRTTGSYELLVCTDTTMEGAKVLSYYRLRFQIEFLIRDAKTYTGMQHCQARSKNKLYNHFNMAMMSVSVVKYRTWATRADKEQQPFSMRSIKTCCLNKYMTQTIFENLALDLSCKKIKYLYNKCLNIGSMAA